MKWNQPMRSLYDAPPRPRVSLRFLIVFGYPFCAVLGAVTGWMVKP